MSGQLTKQTGTQSPKGVSVIFLNRKLTRQLAIDRLNQLAEGIVQVLKSRRDLFLLVGPGDGAQDDSVFESVRKCV